MTNEHDISQVWLGLLDAERLSRYYQAMAARLQRWHMALTAFVALGSTGAVSSLLLGAPDWVAELLAGAVAAVAVWTCYYGHASKAALMEAARDSCADLALCWRELWARLDGLDVAEAWREIRILKHREEAATARVPAHLAADERCAEDTRMQSWGVDMPPPVERSEGAARPPRPPNPKPPPPPKPPPRRPPKEPKPPSRPTAS